MFVVKDENYNMIRMSTYSGVTVFNDQKEKYGFSKGQVLTFKYVESFSCHCLYRGSMDNHNGTSHDDGKKQQVGLEYTWITHRWEISVLSFYNLH